MILVIGDSCTDKFVYGKCERICPEAPVPVFTPTRETANWGMAGNVVNNLRALGEEVYCHTNSIRIEKKRIVDEKTNQMLVRIDNPDDCEPIKEGIRDLYIGEDYEDFRSGLKAVVISDYNKGYLSKEDIRVIINYYDCPVFLDTKKKLGKWCANVDFIKINDVEYANSEELLVDLGIEDKIIVTKGGDGAEYGGILYSTKKCKVQDLSGAGDTFLAGLVHKYCETKNITEAIAFANEVAFKIVQKQGVSVVDTPYL